MQKKNIFRAFIIGLLLQGCGSDSGGLDDKIILEPPSTVKLEKPQIKSIEPDHGMGGDLVVIRGENFLANFILGGEFEVIAQESRLRFDDLKAELVAVEDSVMVVKVPKAPYVSVSLYFERADGAKAKLKDAFTYIAKNPKVNEVTDKITELDEQSIQ